MEDYKKIEIIQNIINSHKIIMPNKKEINKTKLWYIQSVLNGVFKEEEIQWIWED